jgi:hypothetical protein
LAGVFVGYALDIVTSSPQLKEKYDVEYGPYKPKDKQYGIDTERGHK